MDLKELPKKLVNETKAQAAALKQKMEKRIVVPLDGKMKTMDEVLNALEAHFREQGKDVTIRSALRPTITLNGVPYVVLLQPREGGKASDMEAVLLCDEPFLKF